MTEALFLLASYLLGSISGSLLLGRLRGVDIRQMGSGNAGGTNALRTQGLGFALGVVVVDVGKGWLAVMLPSWAASETAAWIPYGCGIAAILGHMYPLFFGFRGGKGAATLIGALLGLAVGSVLWALVAFAVVLVASGYVGLSTIIASWCVVAYFFWRQDVTGEIFALVAAVLITHAHHQNIARLINGTENRFHKARLSYWLNRRQNGE